MFKTTLEVSHLSTMFPSKNLLKTAIYGLEKIYI